MPSIAASGSGGRGRGGQGGHGGGGNGDLADVVRAAAVSRLAIVCLCVSAGLLVPAYDQSGALHTPAHGPDGTSECSGAGSAAVLAALSPLASWDGVFFADIAARGYAHEKQHAFFPATPLAVWAVGGAAHAAVPSVCRPAANLAAAVLVSQAAFCAAAAALYLLGRAVLGDDDKAARAQAKTAALLFCASPASVFFSAAYSESLFAALSLWGCLALERGRALAAAPAFFSAAAVRSNGAALAGFPAYLALAGRLRPAPAALVAAAAAAPSFLADSAARAMYCDEVGGGAPYCALSAVVPRVYGHVQREYWGVSLFGYYEARQAPNFALAAPALVLGFLAVRAYAASDPNGRRSWWWRKRQRRLSCGSAAAAAAAAPSPLAASRAAEPYMLHLAAMLAVCVTVLHVQVSTRFLAACPALYWHAAAVAARGGRAARALVGYHVAYAAVGSVLFSAFYPWT